MKFILINTHYYAHFHLRNGFAHNSDRATLLLSSQWTLRATRLTMVNDQTPLVTPAARGIAAPRAPRADTAAFVIAMLALQAQWAVVYIYLVPQLLELHVSPSWASDAWLLSPVLQLVVSPLAGRLSDRLAGSYGRRRPFILGSTILATTLLLFIPFVPRICAGSLPQGSRSDPSADPLPPSSLRAQRARAG